MSRSCKVAKKACSKDDLISFTLRGYIFKKDTSLRKHIASKHEEHECKECKENLLSLMNLLRHLSKHNFKDKEEEPKLRSKNYAI